MPRFCEQFIYIFFHHGFNMNFPVNIEDVFFVNFSGCVSVPWCKMYKKEYVI